MRVTFGALKGFVRHMLVEAEKETKEKKKKEPDEAPFSCPRHKLPLKAVWVWVEKVVKDPDRSVQPFGPMEPGQSRNILAPTTKFVPKKGEEKKVRMIRSWMCPLWDEDGSYAWDPKKKKGHACDFKVSARITRPGQKYPHEARGEVAEEEGVLFKPITPRKVNEKTPDAFLEMMEMMEQDEFNWKKVQATPKSPPQFKKVPARGKKRFTSDDILYLSYFYPKSLAAQAKEAGKEYKGPKPYYFSGDKIFRAFRAKGWEPADPEGGIKKSKRDIPSMPSKEPSVTAKMIRRPGPGQSQPEETPWYNDDDDPWDEDTEDLDTPDELELDPDDDSMPDRWKLPSE